MKLAGDWMTINSGIVLCSLSPVGRQTLFRQLRSM